MNKQRKVLITITYNEMGIIIDTKAEEVAQPNLQLTCNQLATDCISRSAALDVIRNIRAIAGSYDSEMLLIDKAEAQTELMMMPSAQPERKTGRWIYNNSVFNYWTCSACNIDNGSRTDYCPNCGCHMKGGDSDE